MGNFHRDNADLRFQMRHVPWGDFVPLLEDDFGREADGGPGDLPEAVETYEAVLDLVGEIAADVVAPTAADVDARGARLVDGRVEYAPATTAHLAALREAGLFGFTIDRAHGGQGLPTTLYTASVEIVSRGCASLMTLYALQACGDTIEAFGSEALVARFVPRIASGELTCCMSLSEPDAGSALGSVACRAVPEDEAQGRFRLHGSKVFATNGGGDLLLVLARTEEGTTDARGLSLFVVPRSPQVLVTKLEEKLGLHGSPTAVVHLDGAEGFLVGQRRRGLVTYVMSLIHGARLEVAAQAVGIAQAAMTATTRYVRERRQFGRPIVSFAPVRRQLLEMETRLQAGRNLVYRTARVVDGVRARRRALARHPDDPRADAWRAEAARLASISEILTPLTKYWAAEAANEVCYRALQLHGGYGYVREYGIERLVRDVRVTSLYEGTSEIQAGGIVHLIAAGGVDLVLGEVAGDLPEGSEDAQARARYDAGVAATREAAAFLFAHKDDKELLQLRSRAMADMLADVVSAAVFLRHAPLEPRKRVMASSFLHDAELRWAAGLRWIREGDRAALDGLDVLLAPYGG